MKQIFHLSEGEQNSSFTGRDLLSLLFKHKIVILSTFLLVTLLVAWGLFSLPATYTSSGKVLVETEQQGNPSFFSGVASYVEQQQSDPVNRKMETEMQLVESRPIAEEVVRALNLGFWDLYHKPLVHFLAPVSEVYDAVMQKLFGVAPDPRKYGYEDTVSAFLKSFSVGPVRSKSAETTSNIVQITLRAPDARRAQSMLQKLMEHYAGHDIRLNQVAGERAYEIVEHQTQKAFHELSAAQAELQVLLSNRHSEERASPALTAARDVETIAMIKEQLLGKQLELLEVGRNFDARSERYQTLQFAIDNLSTRLKIEESRYAESDVRLASLEREVTAAEAVYLDLKKRLAQIGLYLDMNQRQVGNRIIIEPAVEPRESSFKKDVLLAVLGSLSGLVLGLGIAGLREYTDHTLGSRDAVRRLFDMDVLGTVPLLKGQQGLAIAAPVQGERQG